MELPSAGREKSDAGAHPVMKDAPTRCGYLDARSDRIAIGARASQKHANPMRIGLAGIHQYRRTPPKRSNNNVKEAILIQVREGSPALIALTREVLAHIF